MQAAFKKIEQLFSEHTGNAKLDWAASTFDYSLYKALPTTINRKLFTKVTRDKTVSFFKLMTAHFEMLLDIRRRVRAKDIDLEDLVHTMRQLNDEKKVDKASSFTRVVFEAMLWVQKEDGEYLFGEQVFYLFAEEMLH
jgi:hypothetical protein